MRRPDIFFTSLLGYAIVSLALLILIPKDPKNAFLLGYSLTRVVFMLGFAVIVLGVCVLMVQMRRNAALQEKVRGFFNGSMKGHTLPTLLYGLLLLSFTLSLLFVVLWLAYNERFGGLFLRSAPVVLFVGFASVHGLLALRVYLPDFLRGLRDFPSAFRKYKVSWLLVLLLAVYLGNTYVQLATRHSQEINQGLQFSDQKSYLVIAENAYETGYRYKGDRNRTPLYPYLLTAVYDSDLDRETFFERSKGLSVILSLGLLLVNFLISLRYLPVWQSAVLTFICGTTLYVYKAGYVQPELMYYTLSFTSFVLMIWMLLRPSIWLAVITGAVAALAYYTKASMLPGLVLFVVLYLAQAAANWIMSTRHGDQTVTAGDFLRTKIFPVLAVILVFLGLLSPYLLENKRISGRYFYNVNSTFYLWYDSWDEVEEGTNAHGDEVGWPDMPPEQIPSLGKYLAEHTSQQILERFVLGLDSQWNNIISTYSKYSFPVIYTIVLIMFALFNLRQSLQLLVTYKYVALFCLLYFIGYFILYAWFAPVANFADERFTYSLYVTYLFSIFVALRLIASRGRIFRVGAIEFTTEQLLGGVHLAALFLALYSFFAIAPTRLSKRWFGK